MPSDGGWPSREPVDPKGMLGCAFLQLEQRDHVQILVGFQQPEHAVESLDIVAITVSVIALRVVACHSGAYG
jgi:hypothetical protein